MPPMARRWHLKNLRIFIGCLTCCSILLTFSAINFGSTAQPSSPPDGGTSWMDSVQPAQADLQRQLLAQLPISLFILFYTYFDIQHRRFFKVKAALATLIIILSLYFTGSVLATMAKAKGPAVLWVVQGMNILLAVLMMVECGTARYLILREKTGQGRSGEGIDVEGDEGDNDDHYSGRHTTTERVPVLLYQPQIALPPTAATLGAGREDDRESVLELDELPAYQRRKPRQVATIVDMTNQASTAEVPEYSADRAEVTLPVPAQLAPSSTPTSTSSTLRPTASTTLSPEPQPPVYVP